MSLTQRPAATAPRVRIAATRHAACGITRPFMAWGRAGTQGRRDAHGATTMKVQELRDFLSPDGAPGYFEQELSAYGRGGEPCPKCGRPLKQALLAQRATVWCGHCQR